MFEVIPIMELLLEFGVDPNYESEVGHAAWRLASLLGYYDTAMLF